MRGRKTLFRNYMMKQGRKLAAMGLTMEEIAEFWGVGKRSLERYSSSRPEFRRVLKEGKIEADLKVVESLYKRAIGYEYSEKHYIARGRDKKLTKIIVKKALPDVLAIFKWLQNRWPHKWRDEYGIKLLGEDGQPPVLRIIPELPVGMELPIIKDKELPKAEEKALEEGEKDGQ